MVTLTFVLATVSSISLPFMSTPYALGSAFMMSLSFVALYMMSVGPIWYPVTMFLIYIGALMVLFLYMACLSPNMRIESPRQALVISTWASLLLVSIIFLMTIPHFISLQPTVNLSEMSISLSSTLSPTDLMSRSNGDMIVLSGLSLFFALLSVVKTCKHQKGPLRAFKRTTRPRNRE
uniref:NADH dehydrogenase subunit 6 n=1 Tax=Lottia digitalis TaxID=225159 RepID=Q2I6Z9_9GAST|nr:NADH dehydrogenase subunit 6 [Lottia digitalis]ABC00941.1 NADH dehydrogenase subunit 6 [Lottia digitalis]